MTSFTSDMEMQGKSASGAIDKLDWSEITANPKKISQRNSFLDRISGNGD
jgi:hypothetical protein